MVDQKTQKAMSDDEKRESGLPGGGKGRRDKIERSGIYPVSEMENAAPDAVVRGERSFGQGERGSAGYEDAGESGVIVLDEELPGKSRKE